jgi:hypothetical protein
VALTNLDKVARRRTTSTRPSAGSTTSTTPSRGASGPKAPLIWFPTALATTGTGEGPAPDPLESVAPGSRRSRDWGACVEDLHPQYTRVFKASDFAGYLRTAYGRRSAYMLETTFGDESQHLRQTSQLRGLRRLIALGRLFLVNVQYLFL